MERHFHLTEHIINLWAKRFDKMPLTMQQTQLAAIVDAHVSHVLSDGRGDEEPLLSSVQCTGRLYGSWYQITSHACTRTCSNFSWAHQPKR